MKRRILPLCYHVKKRNKLIVLFIVGLLILIPSLPEIFHQNNGVSVSKGSVGNGYIENSWLMPYSGKNFRYFSPLSYYILDDAYVHSKVYKTIIESYAFCEKTCEGTRFRIMEGSRKKGGKTLIHRTHQNGLSVDFMVPKKIESKKGSVFDRMGMWHYLLAFSDTGSLNFHKNTVIDFETMGRHILALDDVARNNGLRIKKVILMIELKDDFFNTSSGKMVKQRGIYFAKALTPMINRVHDDHYHVDFEAYD